MWQVTERNNALFVSVTRENDCGFLTSQVVPIPVCSLNKLRTYKNGTTCDE
ncbi:hypothetical protein [Clostridium saccharobutylicum]|uniref:Uncharacterized protein n=1 Tax=Clostridium saccharobutylicum DSM 13864 TaxID=1345695 RepID=U5MWN0_CLOSA|nr:hypothetical protein [Clostridium saccharobutylicum]AGX44990.1 hypothetical protein CLSA_c40300 [Clostridium saccharobutylicum DSM 13864]MBA2903776.1 hypothetical protein [Clostridium saccharobutylicum]MBA8894706.1 hypothetical protein [Clostridium saccharobutylicum]MBA8984390.1 hypothetical protein [Clostridium saccharobutylicum]MBA8997042.1 hypothetical protein [Clostridium saccharobutylicum]